MKTKNIVIAAALISVAVATLVLILPTGYSVSGFFSKAFDKSLGAGESYERNITVRKYYNVSVRFQKEGSSSYLGFDNNESEIVLMSPNGSVIKTLNGIENGRHYVLMEKLEIASIATASAFDIGNYADVVNQSVSFSYIGTKAYLTITVGYGPSSLSGYVIDDLTGNYVDGVHIYAFLDDSDPQTAEAVVQNVSTAGRYMLALQSNSSIAFDVYAKDYDVA
jgi:hypothetical protein